MKNANVQNSTFASHYKQADASTCKGDIFLPTLPSPTATINSSLISIEIKQF